mmetsp:Transcript_25041/g.39801  ORF Transcript_25041/g.39801 Transcript_25041/m.39801 type:complete len:227 (+) Transcript_25041:58-738(+)
MSVNPYPVKSCPSSSKSNTLHSISSVLFLFLVLCVSFFAFSLISKSSVAASFCFNFSCFTLSTSFFFLPRCSSNTFCSETPAGSAPISYSSSSSMTLNVVPNSFFLRGMNCASISTSYPYCSSLSIVVSSSFSVSFMSPSPSPSSSSPSLSSSATRSNNVSQFVPFTSLPSTISTSCAPLSRSASFSSSYPFCARSNICSNFAILASCSSSSSATNSYSPKYVFFS